MKKVGIAGFTPRGKELADQLAHLLQPGWETSRYEKNLKQWCGQCFEDADAIIFIGACGIAVRTIAPFVKSKTTDPAVLVIDEAGQFVISLLSGHIGGANEFAAEVAEMIGAVPVITTASDVNGKIAVDVFAKKNHLAIGSMRDAKDMAAAILRGERVWVYCTGRIEGIIPPELTLLEIKNPGKHREKLAQAADEKSKCSDLEKKADDSDSDKTPRNHKPQHLLWISEYIPQQEQVKDLLGDNVGTILQLIPQSVVLGVGCRRGKPGQEIINTVEQVLRNTGISPKALALAASIDLKKEEPGILELCRKYGLEFVTYPAGELEKVPGDFKSSDFVRKTTGVDNVCERSALLAAGENARLIQEKYAENGVTAALAAREWRVRFEE